MWGGITAAKNSKSLQRNFTKSKITIKEDTYAAVYAASKPGEKCIVCILGTAQLYLF